MSAGDIVLCGLRDYQDDKVDIIHKYNADEARNLKAYGELPDTAKLGAAAGVDGGEDEDEEVPFDFDDI